MIPPHLSSTLFPYTTLFRSMLRQDIDFVFVLAVVGPQLDLRQHLVGERRAHDEAGMAGGAAQLRHERVVHQPGVGANRADRKSTRLNSSHSQISYAVFCLKK